MIEPTTLHCPATGLQPGDDGSTHHLVPRALVLVCRTCGLTEAALREAAQTRPPIERVDAYNITVGGTTIRATPDQETRIRALSAEQAQNLAAIMGGPQ